MTLRETSKVETDGFKAEWRDKGVNELEDRCRLNYAERVNMQNEENNVKTC